MRKNLLYTLLFSILTGIIFQGKAQEKLSNDRMKKILYFNPVVEPDLDEIKEATNYAFFSAVSDNVSATKKNRFLRSEVQIPYDSIDVKTIIEYVKNNDADYVIVPKIKYFKVGIGKYVFSNQVLVSMKVFDAGGNLITSSEYDTYRKNMRLLGSTENSVKIGTHGVMKNVFHEIRKLKTDTQTAL